MSKQDEIRTLRERIYELERHNALMEQAVQRALTVTSFEEAKRFLRHSIQPYRGRWNADIILAKAREWADLHGAPPTALDWNPSQARKYKLHDKVEVFYAGDWPGLSTITHYFDNWNAMIAAAGFETRQRGQNDSREGRGSNSGDKFAHLPPWNGWEFVRGRRVSLGLTQEKLTTLSGLSHNYVVAIERGEQTNPSVRILLALAQPLGVRPGAFFE